MMLKDQMLVLEAQRLIRDERINAEWAVKRAVRKIKQRLRRASTTSTSASAAPTSTSSASASSRTCSARRPTSRGAARGRDRRRPRPVAGRHRAAPERAEGRGVRHRRRRARPRTPPSSRARSRCRRWSASGRITALVERGDLDHRRRRAAASSSINPTAGRAARLRGRARALPEVEEAPPPHARPPGADAGRRHRPPRREHRVRRGGPEPRSPTAATAIGLYRTEFLFLGRGDLPTEEEHYQNYRAGPRGARAAARSRSAPSTSAATSCRPGCASTRRTRRSGCARSATACAQPRDVPRRSCGRCSARRSHGNLRIMFPHDLRGRRAARGAQRARRGAASELERERACRCGGRSRSGS